MIYQIPFKLFWANLIDLTSLSLTNKDSIITMDLTGNLLETKIIPWLKNWFVHQPITLRCFYYWKGSSRIQAYSLAKAIQLNNQSHCFRWAQLYIHQLSWTVILAGMDPNLRSLKQLKYFLRPETWLIQLIFRKVKSYLYWFFGNVWWTNTVEILKYQGNSLEFT